MEATGIISQNQRQRAHVDDLLSQVTTAAPGMRWSAWENETEIDLVVHEKRVREELDIWENELALQTALRELEEAKRVQKNLEDENRRLEDEERGLKSKARTFKSQEEVADQRIRDVMRSTGFDFAHTGSSGVHPGAIVDSLVSVVKGKEDDLRSIEDELMAACKELEAKMQSLGRIANDAALVKAKREARIEALNQELASIQNEIEILQAEIRDLRANAGDPEKKLSELSQAEEQAQEILRSLEDERRRLQALIDQLLAEKQRYEEDMKSKLNELSTWSLSDLRFKLDETMMLLKASVINLNRDYEYIGQIRTAVKSAGPQSYEDAFTRAYGDVRAAVAAIYGIQTAATSSWHLDIPDITLPFGTPAVKIDALLSAMKRMVITYDILPLSSKMQLKESTAVLQNSFTLYNIVRACVFRGKEFEGETRAIKEKGEGRMSGRLGSLGGGAAASHGGPSSARVRSRSREVVSGGGPHAHPPVYGEGHISHSTSGDALSHTHPHYSHTVASGPYGSLASYTTEVYGGGAHAGPQTALHTQTVTAVRTMHVVGDGQRQTGRVSATAVRESR